MPGTLHHMVMLISEFLSDLDVEAVHLYGTNRYVEADGIFVHVDLSVVPRRIRRFAQPNPSRSMPTPPTSASASPWTAC